MASKMEYEPESPYKAPLSYDVEEGELSCGSGRSSPGTIRDNNLECHKQTDEYVETVTSMRVELDNTNNEQYTQTALNQLIPQDIARIIAEKTVRPKTTDVRKNIMSFRNGKNNNVEEQSTSTTTHSYQNNRPQNRPQNNISNNTSTPRETYTSPPLPNYPPPVRPPPPEGNTTNSHKIKHRVQQRWFERNSHHIRPNNLRFLYAVTPRSNNRKSFIHQSTNEQTPTATVMKTIYGSKKRTQKH